MADSPPRKHHYLPQFYMRAFANDKEQVRVVDREARRQFTVHTEKVFAERDYYTVASEDAEDDYELIEGLYTQVDGQAAPIFRRLLADDFPLDGQSRADFAGFMAIQITRGPEHQRMITQTTSTLGHAMLRAYAEAPPGYWERKRAAWEANPVGPEPPVLTEDQRQAFRDGTAFTLTPSREHVVETRFEGSGSVCIDPLICSTVPAVRSR